MFPPPTIPTIPPDFDYCILPPQAVAVPPTNPDGHNPGASGSAPSVDSGPASGSGASASGSGSTSTSQRASVGTNLVVLDGKGDPESDVEEGYFEPENFDDDDDRDLALYDDCDDDDIKYSLTTFANATSGSGNEMECPQNPELYYAFINSTPHHETNERREKRCQIYYYFMTLEKEFSMMWPRKWRTGKILFLSARYMPMLVMTDRILIGMQVYVVIPPKICEGLLIAFEEGCFVSHAKALTLGTALAQISYASERVVAIFALALVIFGVRYKHKGGSLIQIIRRDSGLYIFLLTGLALGIAIVGTFRLQGFYNLQNPILDSIQRTVVPVLSCRLLLNMHLTEDPDLRTNVSTILFDPPSPGEDDDDDDDGELRDTPVPMVHFKGLGRRRGGDEVSIPSTLAGSASNVVVESGQRV
ncbi:hypothetical protein DFP72DRAFT_850342 [Ephemerocybe angulata]|uniref:DUF6533 domain-containing protein n=1 Tax=Ephemerocybe angulata TaxID=980116 RepID=A0A8H6HT21_9AGAR|nr:hypothetical protein DFP72DRAFT_850342 [Tulosesus angulatus]